MAHRTFDQDSLIGLRLGHYLVVERIGAGGMGEVYRARDEHLDRDVAIKVLPSSTCASAKVNRSFANSILGISARNA
jgi:eukaryotic-like serine/threonine-protein kinase